VSFEKEHRELEEVINEELSDEKLKIVALSMNDLIKNLYEADESNVFGGTSDSIALDLVTNTMLAILSMIIAVDAGATLEKMRELGNRADREACNALLFSAIREATAPNAEMN
jgi:hemerythrin superfamily protein